LIKIALPIGVVLFKKFAIRLAGHYGYLTHALFLVKKKQPNRLQKRIIGAK
jgi:hypothetical protein